MATIDKRSGMTLLIESLHKPDPKLRGCAYNQVVLELMQYRDECIEYLQGKLKEIQENG